MRAAGDFDGGAAMRALLERALGGWAPAPGQPAEPPPCPNSPLPPPPPPGPVFLGRPARADAGAGNPHGGSHHVGSGLWSIAMSSGT